MFSSALQRFDRHAVMSAVINRLPLLLTQQLSCYKDSNQNTKIRVRLKIGDRPQNCHRCSWIRATVSVLDEGKHQNVGFM